MGGGRVITTQSAVLFQADLLHPSFLIDPRNADAKYLPALLHLELDKFPISGGSNPIPMV